MEHNSFKNNPKISVVMSTHNGERFIRQAIDSILGQTYGDFEFLIIDDGSTDLTPVILEEYSQRDKRIRIITNKECLGLTKSLNIGFRQAQGEFIARMDDDDICDKNRFSLQDEFLNNNSDVVLCGSLANVINENGEIIREKKLALGYENIKKSLLFNNQFIHSSLMIRKSVLEKQGFYNEDFKKAQDYELILRLAAKYRVENLEQKLVSWRYLNSSISNKNNEQKKYAIKARWWAITKYGYPKIKGLFHIILRTAQLYA